MGQLEYQSKDSSSLPEETVCLTVEAHDRQPGMSSRVIDSEDKWIWIPATERGFGKSINHLNLISLFVKGYVIIPHHRVIRRDKCLQSA